MGWGIFDKISDTVKDVGDFGGKTITTGVEFGGKAIDAATKEIKNVVEKGSAIVDWAASVPGLDVVLQKIKESEIPGTDITVAEGLAIAETNMDNAEELAQSIKKGGQTVLEALSGDKDTSDVMKDFLTVFNSTAKYYTNTKGKYDDGDDEAGQELVHSNKIKKLVTSAKKVADRLE